MPDDLLEEPVFPAKLTDRFLAYLVDTIPFVAGYYASLLLLVTRLRELPNTVHAWRELFFLWLGLYVAYHWAGNMLGATLGKALLGLRVRRRDGERLGPGGSLLRAAGLLASTPLFNLGFLWAFLDPESRTWHDLLSGSRVVETERKSSAESIGTALVSFLILGGILGWTAWFYVLRQTPADRDAIARAKKGLNILSQVEEQYKGSHGQYTERLTDLAAASGNVEQFRDGMAGLFDPDRILIEADGRHFYIRAYARDRRATPVSVRGPGADSR